MSNMYLFLELCSSMCILFYVPKYIFYSLAPINFNYHIFTRYILYFTPQSCHIKHIKVWMFFLLTLISTRTFYLKLANLKLKSAIIITWKLHQPPWPTSAPYVIVFLLLQSILWKSMNWNHMKTKVQLWKVPSW